MDESSQPSPIDIPAALQAILRNAKHVLIFTGAGVSAESGIPTFRDALTGLWQQFDAEELATRNAYRKHPSLVWGWYEWRRGEVMKASPNPAHIAIAALERQVPKLTLVTQNIDDLHERAGSTAPIHLHGSLHAPRCFACHRPHDLPLGIPDMPHGGLDLEPPRCTRCGGRIRPGVVWFGEDLPAPMLHKAMAAVKQCDLLFSIGTSSLVWPAADIPHAAARRGVPVVQVNPLPTQLDKVARFNLRGAAGEIMPMIGKVFEKDKHE